MATGENKLKCPNCDHTEHLHGYGVEQDGLKKVRIVCELCGWKGWI